MTTLTQSLRTLILAVILSIGVSYVYAWTGPTATAPGGNTPAPINVSGTDQIKSGGLWVGSLASGGGVRIGTTNAACTTAISGTLRYYSGNIQYCNGSVWGALSSVAAQEWTTPGGPNVFTAPTGVTSITLSLAGGGGGGAGGDMPKDGRIDEVLSTRGGGGGGGGQGVLNQMVAVTPGQQIQVRVGGGGTGGGVAVPGNAGGNSSFGSIIGAGGSGGQKSVGTNTTWSNSGVYCRGPIGGSGLNGSLSSLAQSVYGASTPGTGGSGGTTCSPSAIPGGNAEVYSAGGGGGGVGGSGTNSSGGGSGSSGFVRVSW